MLTENQLLDRDKITEAEVRELMEGLDVLIMDICEACGVSKNTMDIYLGENTTPLPVKHQSKIIHLFLKEYAKQDGKHKKVKVKPPKTVLKKPDPRKEPDSDVVDYASLDEEDKKEKVKKLYKSMAAEGKVPDTEYPTQPKNGIEWKEKDELAEQPETYDHIDKKFKHLSFEKIVFRPKNGNLGEALLEALKYSRKVSIPVHVRKGDKLIKISED